MLKDIAAVGDKIELMKFSNQDAAIMSQKWYTSQLLDYVDIDKACIAMPIEGGRIIPLDLTEKYQVVFYTKYGLYQCRATVIDRYRSDNVFMVVIQLTSDLEKYQRRQYYRLACIIDSRICSLLEQEIESVKKQADIILPEERYVDSNIIDISGGGCKLNTSILIEKGKTVLVEFSLQLAKGIVHFRILGKVVFSSEVLSRKKTYEHRLEFVDVKEEDREQIVRYIFDEERRRRRKEKGLS